MLPVVLLALVAGTTTPSYRSGVPQLPSAVDASTLVCIGRIDGAVTVPFPDGIAWQPAIKPQALVTELSFARVKVERVLKGEPAVKEVFLEAWVKNNCAPMTDAKGQRALFFLCPDVMARSTSTQREIALTRLGSSRIYGSIGPLVPIQGDPAAEYVVWSGLPRSMNVEGFKDRQRLTDVIAYTEALARFDPAQVVVHARCQATAMGSTDRSRVGAVPFDLRILRDGSRRLSRGEVWAEEVVVDAIDAKVWSALQVELAKQVGDADRTFGNAQDADPERLLVVRADKHSLVFYQHDFRTLPEADEVHYSTIDRAIRAWGAITATITCPTCVDFGPSDARWLRGDHGY